MDLVTDLVTYLVTFLVTFSTENYHELMRRFMIFKRHVRLLFHRTNDTSTCTSIWQQVVGIGKQKLISWHRRTLHDILHRQAIRQFARTMYLHPVIEDKDAYGRLPV